MSPCLFKLLMTDLDEVLGEEGWGRIKVGGKKIYSLAYTDDVAVVAEDEDGIKGMIKVCSGKVCGGKGVGGKRGENKSDEIQKKERKVKESELEVEETRVKGGEKVYL